MIDRQNTINYLNYLLRLEKINLKKIDLKKLERITLTSKISLLENIISSIAQMPEALKNNNVINKKELIIKEYDENKLRKNANNKILEQYDINNNLINEYYSPTDAHNKTGINVSGILNNISKRQMTAGGYIWKYKNKDGDLNE